MIEIELLCNQNEKGTIKISAAIMNADVFWQAYSTLSISTLQVTKFSNTEVIGTINCNRDGVMYTSIPQNGNWYAYVDNQPVDTVLIGDAMLGLLLPQGEHTIRLVYRNDAFALGWKITLACMVVFIGIVVAVYKPKFKQYQGKYEQATN